MTSILPLLFVLSITALKQAYENILKWRVDNMVNQSLVVVIRNGKEQEIMCEDIVQGDLVKVSRDCDVPCDLVLLKSSEESEKCFITTVNLDGESNLKTLLVPKGLPALETSEYGKSFDDNLLKSHSPQMNSTLWDKLNVNRPKPTCTLSKVG
jgi:phospholipid-translocating ATPase